MYLGRLRKRIKIQKNSLTVISFIVKTRDIKRAKNEAGSGAQNGEKLYDGKKKNERDLLRGLLNF